MDDWQNRTPLVLEVVPSPLRLGERGVEKCLAEVAEIHAAVNLDAINIPEIREEESKSAQGERRNPFEPRVEPRRLAARIQEHLDLECIVNRVVVHRAEPGQAEWFRETHDRFGVRSFVLVGGEKSQVPYPGPTVPRANQLIRETLGNSLRRVGNITIPSRRSEIPDEPERMAHKVKCGASFFTSQIVYQPEELTRLLTDLARRCPESARVPILVSLCPLRSARSIAFLRWLGVSLSDSLEESLDCQRQGLLERSIQHLLKMWVEIQTQLREHSLPTPLGLN
ncbi:MAG: methylenetetrahydrofolate reductase, partial [Planctomycetota bacterium]